MISNRIKLSLIAGSLLLLVLGGWIVSTPSYFFRSYWYWLSFSIFFVYGGFFFLPRGPLFPIPGKTKRRRGYGFLLPLPVAGALFFLSNTYPNASIAEFAILLGLFAGAAVKFAYLIVFRSRWSFCPKCGNYAWIQEFSGKWYCNKKGHLFTGADGESPTVKGVPAPTQASWSFWPDSRENNTP